ncbi:hypothetical protein J5X98_19175 [Leptothermofonsia sichuanensis E412]|uniref:hypothetical protein n=1 Tax=Leptothermofonsia sichuanensis TaxID=2917832 RepID=UPI001CA63B9A|nr:hypothetical protein [Leptothermofonsia sichuanensis]QZZ19470.1 hypothetical protein J5X98_19175 [Leptothermofonsia sichuanensis E412]
MEYLLSKHESFSREVGVGRSRMPVTLTTFNQNALLLYRTYPRNSQKFNNPMGTSNQSPVSGDLSL